MLAIGAAAAAGFIVGYVGAHFLKQNYMRLGQKSQPLNCLWIVEQDAVVEWALLR